MEDVIVDVSHELSPGRIVVLDLKLAVNKREAVSELFLPYRLVDLLKLSEIVLHNLFLVLFIDKAVQGLSKIVRDGHDVLVQHALRDAILSAQGTKSKLSQLKWRVTADLRFFVWCSHI